MKLKHLFLFGMAASFLAACSDSDDVVTNENAAISFISNTSSFDTRVSVNGTEWIAGDAVGIYMSSTGGSVLSGNTKYTANNAGESTLFTFAGSTGSALEYPTDGSAVDFLAYYPYSASVSNDFIYSVALDNQAEGITAHDLMVATLTNKSTGSVSLTFAHKLSKLSFYVVDSDGAAVTPSNVVIKGMNTTASYNLSTNGITSEDNQADITPQNANDIYHAILLPVTLSASHVITFSVNGASYSWKLTDQTQSTAITQFAEGTGYAFKIKVPSSGGEATAEAVSLGDNTILDWKDGVVIEGDNDDQTAIPSGYTTFEVGTTYSTIADALTAVGSETKVAISLKSGQDEAIGNIYTIPSNITHLWIGYDGYGRKPTITTTGNGFTFAEGGAYSEVTFYNLNVGGGYLMNNSNTSGGNYTIDNVTLKGCEFAVATAVVRNQASSVAINNVLFEDCFVSGITGNYGLFACSNGGTDTATLTVNNTVAYNVTRLITIGETTVVDCTFNSCTISDITYQIINGSATTTEFNDCVFHNINGDKPSGSAVLNFTNCFVTTGSSTVDAVTSNCTEAGQVSSVFTNYPSDFSILSSNTTINGNAGAEL